MKINETLPKFNYLAKKQFEMIGMFNTMKNIDSENTS